MGLDSPHPQLGRGPGLRHIARGMDRRHPEAFAGPAIGPVDRVAGVVAGKRVGLRARLDEVLDYEPVGAKDPDPCAVGEGVSPGAISLVEGSKVKIRMVQAGRNTVGGAFIADAQPRTGGIKTSRPPGTSTRVASETL